MPEIKCGVKLGIKGDSYNNSHSPRHKINLAGERFLGLCCCTLDIFKGKCSSSQEVPLASLSSVPTPTAIVSFLDSRGRLKCFFREEVSHQIDPRKTFAPSVYTPL